MRFRFQHLLLAILAALYLGPKGALAQDDLKGVAVYPFAAKGGADGALAEGLTSLLVQELGAAPCVRIVAEDIIRDLARQQGLEQSCGTESCQIDLAQQAKADLLVRGDLAKLGSNYALTGFVIELESRRTVGTDRAFAKNQDELISQTLALARQLRPSLGCPGDEPQQVTAAPDLAREPVAESAAAQPVTAAAEETSGDLASSAAPAERPPAAAFPGVEKIFGPTDSGPIGLLLVEVTDENAAPLPATVTLERAGTEAVIQLAYNPKDSPLEMTLPAGDYVLSAVSPGRVSGSTILALKDHHRLRVPFPLDLPEGNQTRESLRETVNYGAGEVDFPRREELLLKRLSVRMANDSGILRMEIVGHAAEGAAGKSPLQVALERAAKIRELFVRRGVAARRLVIYAIEEEPGRREGPLKKLFGESRERVEFFLWRNAKD